jgi:HlyD family secretion protein
VAAKKTRRLIWTLISIALIGCLAIGYLKFFKHKPDPIDPERLVRVEQMDLARLVVATGKIEPTTKVEIKSKASGIILKLPVNVGDVVSRGQVICELDQNDLLPRVRQSRAALGNG